jgi:ferredoxin
VGRTPDKFGEAIADNYAWIVNNKPNRLVIYDLVRVMEGPMGPVSGPMKKWDLILVGTDELALDIIALKIGKFNGRKHVPHLKSASERELGTYDLDKIKILGLSLEEARKLTPKFKVPGKFLTRLASFITRNIVYKVTKKIPVLKKKLCIKCGQCFEVCPANAINFIKGKHPEFLRRECISCLCCMEMCPQEAIKPKLRGFGGLFHSY